MFTHFVARIASTVSSLAHCLPCSFMRRETTQVLVQISLCLYVWSLSWVEASC